MVRMAQVPDVQVEIIKNEQHPAGVSEPGVPPFRLHYVMRFIMPAEDALDGCL